MRREEIFKIVVSHARSILPELTHHEFQNSDKLADLGANSLDRADIVTATLDSLSLETPRVELFGARNLGELVDLLHERSESR